jgi:hypothetical protein
MAALITDRNTPFKEGGLISVPVAAGVKIFSGALVALNAAGYATPGAVSATLTYLGRSDSYADNTVGADGAATVLVRRHCMFKFLNSGADPVAQADVGKTCYILDDQTIAKTSAAAARSAAGKVMGVEADGVWVE